MPSRLAPTGAKYAKGKSAMSEQLTPFATSKISVFLVEEIPVHPIVIKTLETVEQNKRIHNNEVFPIQCTINKVNPEIATTRFSIL